MTNANVRPYGGTVKIKVSVGSRRAAERIASEFARSGKDANVTEGTTELRPFYQVQVGAWESAVECRASIREVVKALPMYAKFSTSLVSVCA